MLKTEHFRGLEPGARLQSVPKEVEKLNALLRAELGTLGSYPVNVIGAAFRPFQTLPGNETPHYQWLWSENLVRDVWLKTYDWVGETVLRPVRKSLTVRATTSPRNRWVLSKALAVASEEDWYRTFPQVKYPGQIHWEEVMFNNKLLCPVLPSRQLTLEAIGCIRKDRESQQTIEEMEQDWYKANQRERQSQIDKAMGVLDPYRPVRPQMPGKRNAGVWHRNEKLERGIV